MDDTGNLHVLEAAFVAILLLTAMSFVLTFSMPTDPDRPVEADLERSARTSLGTFYDMPLSDPAYGNNTLSKALAESLRGNPGNLTDQLNATLPPGAVYNMYLNNGFGVLPIHETRDPQGQTISISRPIEPRWTYTFLSTDVSTYPSDTTLKQTVYGLPVVKGMPIREGGVDVDVVVEGQRHVPAVGDSGFQIGATHAVLQSNRTSDPDPLPHVSLTFQNDTDGDGDGDGDGEDLELEPEGSIVHDDTGAGLTNETLHLRIEETSGEPVPAGTKLTLHVPRGWNASAANTTDWLVVHNATDPNRTDSLVVKFKDELKMSALDLTVNASYHGDVYDYYRFRAELGSPVGGTANLLVKLQSASSTFKGEVPEAVVSAPRFLGDSGHGTWTLALANPPSADLLSNLTVEKITVDQPDGHGIFGAVTELSESHCTGTWSHVSESVLEWTPDGTCRLTANEVLDLTFEVESSGKGVPGAANVPFRPPASYSNDFETTLLNPIAQGFYQQKVPSQTATYPGYPDQSGAQTVESRTSYNSIPVRGDTPYDTAGLTVFKDALAMGRLESHPATVPVGKGVDVRTNVESLLLLLADKGFNPTVKTHVYAPWSMGRGVPYHTVDHTEQDVKDKGNVVALAVHNMNGDGTADILVATDESRIHGLHGETGVKLTGVQKNFVGSTITVFEKMQFEAGVTHFVVGFEDRASEPELIVYDQDLNSVWTKDLDANVVSVTAEHNYTGTPRKELAVGLSDGSAHVYDTATWTEHYSLGVGTAAAKLDQGTNMGLDSEDLLLRTTGLNPKLGFQSEYFEQTAGTLRSDGSELPEAGKLASAVKGVGVGVSNAGMDGSNATGDTKWEYLSSSFDAAGVGDVDRNGVEDMVGGRWDGYLTGLNGTQGNGEFAVYEILSGNTIVDAEAFDEYWMATLSKDGILMWTADGWTTRAYYWGSTGATLTNFPHARGLDYLDRTEGWVVWGLTGNNINFTKDNGVTFNKLDYDLTTSDDDPMVPESDVAWEGIQWAGTSSTDGVLYGGDCRDLALDLTALDGALHCPDGFIAYAVSEDTWKGVNLPLAEDHRINDVHLYSGTSGFAVGLNGAVYHTDNLQDWTWLGLKVDGVYQTDNLRGVHFHNSTLGVAVGDEGVIFRTTSGGDEWTKVTSPTNRDLHDVTFQDTDTGWVVGNESTVARTYDGGEQWTSVFVPMASDKADSIDYHAVTAPHPRAAWVAGGKTSTVNSGPERVIGMFTNYDRSGDTARSTVLNNPHIIEGIRNATVTPDIRNSDEATAYLFISNDACQTFKNATPVSDAAGLSTNPVTVTFDDAFQDQLCFEVRLDISNFYSSFWSPNVKDLTIEYWYTTDAANPDWQKATLDVDMTKGSNVDTDATTAKWDTDEGIIGARLMDNLWSHVLEGAVNHVSVEDLDSDGYNEALVGTGDQWVSSAKKAHPVNDPDTQDRRVYVVNATTGNIALTSAELPGRVVSITTTQLTNLTKDTVRDLLVITEEPGATGGPEMYNLTALDGTDLTELWNTSASSRINDVVAPELSGDGQVEAVMGTDVQTGAGKPGSGEVRATHGDWDPLHVMWRAYPDLKGTYSFTYNVPRNAVFGPYVVETQVVWEASPGVTQSARLYDYFIATPTSGEVPPSPLYNVELVVWYEDWG